VLNDGIMNWKGCEIKELWGIVNIDMRKDNHINNVLSSAGTPLY
jgi:hypothetical protein